MSTGSTRRCRPTILAPPLDDASIELGAIYRSDAILGGADANGGDLIEDPRHPSGGPGTRVPHIMLQRDGTRVSTHDLAGTGFALLAGSGGQAWIEAAEALSATEGPILAAHRIAPDGDLADPDGLFEQIVGIGPEGALLLRPDGVIAWRTQGGHVEPRAQLETVLRRLTFREIAGSARLT